MSNVTIKKYNSGVWDTIYPKTTIAQVINLSTSLANMQSDINGKLAASDISAWAKAATKPSYSHSEVGAAAASHTHTKAQITDFAHTHTKAQITDFAHTHGSISNIGTIGTIANLMIKTGVNGALIAMTAGTTSQYLRGDGTWGTPPNSVYTHPTHPGDDFDIDSGALTGSAVVSDIDINVTTDNLGHVTDANGSLATRNLDAIRGQHGTDLRFWKGTQAQYNAIGTKNSNTIYFVTG